MSLLFVDGDNEYWSRFFGFIRTYRICEAITSYNIMTYLHWICCKYKFSQNLPEQSTRAFGFPLPPKQGRWDMEESSGRREWSVSYPPFHRKARSWTSEIEGPEPNSRFYVLRDGFKQRSFSQRWLSQYVSPSQRWFSNVDYGSKQ